MNEVKDKRRMNVVLCAIFFEIYAYREWCSKGVRLKYQPLGIPISLLYLLVTIKFRLRRRPGCLLCLIITERLQSFSHY